MEPIVPSIVLVIAGIVLGNRYHWAMVAIGERDYRINGLDRGQWPLGDSCKMPGSLLMY